MEDQFMALLFAGDISRRDRWITAFENAMPELELLDRVGKTKHSARYALAWKPEPGYLASIQGLEVIFSLGAGIDHLQSDPSYPYHIPTVRMVDPGLTNGMAEFILSSVFYHHRLFPFFASKQRSTEWVPEPATLAANTTVGVMGMGVLGTASALLLNKAGFEVIGWSKTKKSLPDIHSYHGDGQLHAFLERCQLLICLLPLTFETENILNLDLFHKLPQGAVLINAGRGQHLVEEDLLQALAQGQVSAATLDVFCQEPLPQDHPFWSNPKIQVIPHVAAITYPETGAQRVVENINRHKENQQLLNLVDWDQGY